MGLPGSLRCTALPESRTFCICIIIIIITRPKPAYGRQGLAGSWGQDTDKVSNFWVFLTSHFAQLGIKPTWDHSCRYKSTWHHENQTWSHNKNMKNQPETMKNQPGTMRNHENRPKTMRHQPGTMKNQ